jgi:hypothetical protein
MNGLTVLKALESYFLNFNTLFHRQKLMNEIIIDEEHIFLPVIFFY